VGGLCRLQSLAEAGERLGRPDMSRELIPPLRSQNREELGLGRAMFGCFELMSKSHPSFPEERRMTHAQDIFNECAFSNGSLYLSDLSSNGPDRCSTSRGRHRHAHDGVPVRYSLLEY